jgi:transcriptional regulator with XRE-family HTH domain
VPSTDADIGIGSRVSAARRRLGWSREALAFHAGISWSAISQLETGRRRNLRPGTLAALAGALGMTLDYLVSGGAFSSTMLEHWSLVYQDDAQFLRVAAPFVADAAERSEATLVVTTADHIELLQERVGARRDDVEFADGTTWCVSPIAAVSGFREFVSTRVRDGSPWIRILSEPTRAGRSPRSANAFARYESLLNLALHSAPLTMLCAYDAQALDDDDITHVQATHPHMLEGESPVPNPAYADPLRFILDGETTPQNG